MKQVGIVILGFVALGVGILGWQTTASHAQAAAAAPAPARIGVIDLMVVQERAVPVKQRIDAASKSIETLQTSMESKLTELESLTKERENQSVLSGERRAQIASRINALDDEVRELNLKIASEMSKAKKYTIQEALDLIQNAVDSVAQRDGYALVLRTDSAVYAVPGLDITQTVIDYLNSAPGN